jgi:hypothetical protein
MSFQRTYKNSWFLHLPSHLHKKITAMLFGCGPKTEIDTYLFSSSKMTAIKTL